MVGNRLTLIYSTSHVPRRVQRKLAEVLGDRAIGLTGEVNFGTRSETDLANSAVKVPFQPGLWRVIRESCPDVLISEGFFQWSFAALLYRILHRVPLVVCYERTSYTERAAQWYRRLYRQTAVRLVDAICCNGEQCVEYVRSLGVPLWRITTGHMVVDVEELAANSARARLRERDAFRRQLGADGVVFLYVGALSVRKGIWQLAEAWRAFTECAARRATLLVVGEGPLSGKLREYAQTAGLTSLRLVGAVDYDRLPEYYAAADVFILPTLEDNWSLVVPEAMACGLPILTTPYNGCSTELVKEGINGYLFDPLKPGSTLGCLMKVAADPAVLPRMGEESRAIVANFTPQRAAHGVLKACQIALTQRWRRW